MSSHPKKVPGLARKNYAKTEARGSLRASSGSLVLLMMTNSSSTDSSIHLDQTPTIGPKISRLPTLHGSPSLEEGRDEQYRDGQKYGTQEDASQTPYDRIGSVEE